MDIDKIRMLNLRYWEAQLGRNALRQIFGYPDFSYLSQLFSPKAPAKIGNGAAKRFSVALGKDEGWFDRIHLTEWEEAGLLDDVSVFEYRAYKIYEDVKDLTEEQTRIIEMSVEQFKKLNAADSQP